MLRRTADVAAAVALVGIAAAARALPPDSASRLLLTLPMVLLVPGYLLVQTLTKEARPAHVAAGIGISPPLVGLLALTTAIVPGGFRPAAIVAVVSIASIALAVVALWRRGLFTKEAAAA